MWSLCVPRGRGAKTAGPRPLRALQQCGGQAGAVSHFGYVHIQSRSMAPQHTSVISSGLKHKPEKERRRFEWDLHAVSPRANPRHHSPIRLMHWLLLCPLLRSNTPRRSRLSPCSCGPKPPSEGTHKHAFRSNILVVACVFTVRRDEPTCVFQMWTHLSKEPLARCLPSGLKATL